MQPKKISIYPINFGNKVQKKMISSAGFSKHVFKKHVKLCHTYSEMSKGF